MVIAVGGRTGSFAVAIILAIAVPLVRKVIVNDRTRTEFIHDLAQLFRRNADTPDCIGTFRFRVKQNPATQAIVILAPGPIHRERIIWTVALTLVKARDVKSRRRHVAFGRVARFRRIAHAVFSDFGIHRQRTIQRLAIEKEKLGVAAAHVDDCDFTSTVVGEFRSALTQPVLHILLGFRRKIGTVRVRGQRILEIEN